MDHIICRFYDGAKGNIYAVRPADLGRDKNGNIIHRGGDQWRRPRTTDAKDTELLAPYRCRIDHAGVMAGKDNETWGILVKALMLEGPFQGDSFLAAHLNAVTVKVGQVVEAGAVIGWEGWTGHTIPAGPGGKHSHIEHLAGTSFTPKDPSALLGIPRVRGVEFINDYRPGKQEEDENVKLKIFAPLDTESRSSLIAQGLVGIMGADGKMRTYDLNGDARMARAYTPESLSPTFEDMRDQMLPYEAMFAVDD